VGIDTFDGKGGVTTSASVSLNGNIVPVVATGTYKVNSDCTGTYVIPGTTLFLVIADSGNEIHAICIDSGVVQPHLPEAISSGRLEAMTASSAPLSTSGWWGPASHQHFQIRFRRSGRRAASGRDLLRQPEPLPKGFGSGIFMKEGHLGKIEQPA
jgi:hypothetical protein